MYVYVIIIIIFILNITIIIDLFVIEFTRKFPSIAISW